MLTHHEMLLLVSTELQLEREAACGVVGPAAVRRRPRRGGSAAVRRWPRRVRRWLRATSHHTPAAAGPERAARGGAAGTLTASAASGGPAR
jgi:hypothetical protein